MASILEGKRTNTVGVHKLHQEFQAGRTKYTLSQIDFHTIGVEVLEWLVWSSTGN